MTPCYHSAVDQLLLVLGLPVNLHCLKKDLKRLFKLEWLKSLSMKSQPFLFLFIFFCNAAARTAFPFRSSGVDIGLDGLEIPPGPTPPPPICNFFGVDMPVPPPPPSLRGKWTLRVSNDSSVTHSSNLLLTEIKRSLLHTAYVRDDPGMHAQSITLFKKSYRHNFSSNDRFNKEAHSKNIYMYAYKGCPN